MSLRICMCGCVCIYIYIFLCRSFAVQCLDTVRCCAVAQQRQQQCVTAKNILSPMLLSLALPRYFFFSLPLYSRSSFCLFFLHFFAILHSLSFSIPLRSPSQIFSLHSCIRVCVESHFSFSRRFFFFFFFFFHYVHMNISSEER